MTDLTTQRGELAILLLATLCVAPACSGNDAGQHPTGPAWCMPIAADKPMIVDFEGLTNQDLTSVNIAAGGHVGVFGYDLSGANATLNVESPGASSSAAGHVHLDASVYGIEIGLSPFLPDCWAANAFRGLSFDVKGTGGTVTALITTLQDLTVSQSGECPLATSDCSPFAATAPISATAWSSQALTWDQFKTSWTKEPLNPGEITFISFDIPGAGSAADLWLDNVALLKQ